MQGLLTGWCSQQGLDRCLCALKIAYPYKFSEWEPSLSWSGLLRGQLGRLGQAEQAVASPVAWLRGHN